MIIPSKITPYKKSILCKLPYILDKLQQEDEKLVKLWDTTQSYFDDINEFILALDVAFVLGTIEYSKDNGVIKYVKQDNM